MGRGLCYAAGMSSFTTPLRVGPVAWAPTAKGFWARRRETFCHLNEWEVAEPFRFRLGHRHSNLILEILAGMRTNFASIPAPARLFFKPWENTHGKPAVLHDEGYANHGYFLVGQNGVRKFMPMHKDAVDAMFNYAMCVTETPKAERTILYESVNLFGQAAWDAGEYPKGAVFVMPEEIRELQAA